MDHDTKREPLRRLSISLPESLCARFEKLIDRRGYRSRSQAIAGMISTCLAEGEGEGESEEPGGTDVIATVILGYKDPGSRFLLEMLALNRLHRENIVSSSRRLFADDFTVDVILLQGPRSTLVEIGDQFATLRGVQSAKLNFV